MRSSILPILLSFILVACGSKKISYPDSVAGLERLCDDMFFAVMEKDISKAKAIGGTLKLENPEAWFKKTFGDKVGPRLAEAHAELPDPTQIGGLFL